MVLAPYGAPPPYGYNYGHIHPSDAAPLSPLYYAEPMGLQSDSSHGGGLDFGAMMQHVHGCQNIMQHPAAAGGRGTYYPAMLKSSGSPPGAGRERYVGSPPGAAGEESPPGGHGPHDAPSPPSGEAGPSSPPYGSYGGAYPGPSPPPYGSYGGAYPGPGPDGGPYGGPPHTNYSSPGGSSPEQQQFNWSGGSAGSSALENGWVPPPASREDFVQAVREQKIVSGNCLISSKT